MKITLGDATTTVPDIKKLDAYLKRKLDDERIRVVPRLEEPAEFYVGEEYIGVLFFDKKETPARPTLNCRSWHWNLDEPGLLKG